MSKRGVRTSKVQTTCAARYRRIEVPVHKIKEILPYLCVPHY